MFATMDRDLVKQRLLDMARADPGEMRPLLIGLAGRAN
jgi:hypothetical protein